jgi:hypothetical protein
MCRRDRRASGEVVARDVADARDETVSCSCSTPPAVVLSLSAHRRRLPVSVGYSQSEASLTGRATGNRHRPAPRCLDVRDTLQPSARRPSAVGRGP